MNKKIDITDYMIEFQKLKVSIENNDFIIIIGKNGTGKTYFVNKCLEKMNKIRIINVDNNYDKNKILKQLEMLDMLKRKKIFIFDDKTISMNFVNRIEKIFKRDDIKKNNKFIITVHKLSGFFPLNVNVHRLKYPKRYEVLRYLKQLKVDDNLIKIILNIPKYNLRRIQYTLEDGFYSGYEEINNKFNLTNNNYLLSMSIAENLFNLRKLKEDIIDADKYKFNNNYFYLNYLNLFYRDISKKKLRYPKELLNIKKSEKTGKV